MTVTWQRKAKLKKKISILPKAVADAVRAAMEEAAQSLVDAMKGLVPVDSGKLRDSIAWCWGNAPKNAKVLSAFKSGKWDKDAAEKRITIFAGDYEAFYARWVEFGTQAREAGAYRDESGHRRNAGAKGHKATPARPFFYPSWRAQKKRIAARMSRRINAAIKKVAAG